MKRLLYIPFDQLNPNYGVLKDASPKTDEIVFVESQRMLAAERWHIQRLFFLISSARHFANALESIGFKTHYVKSKTTKTGILDVAKRINAEVIIAAEPSSFRLTKELTGTVQFIENDFFLTPRREFSNWAKGYKKLLMENFYRSQRKRLDILMAGDEPIGGRWNYDDENRESLPDDDYKFPNYLIHELDEIDQEVIAELKSSKLDLWGEDPDGTWATTRDGALAQLDHFLKKNFAKFGPYEDAMTTKNWAVHHSLLSPYLNNGLLHAEEVVAAVMKNIKKHEIPIQSVEGFIRQVIGWREYVNGVYWHFGDDYRHSNFWKAKGELPPLFENPELTQMSCMKNLITDIKKRSWVHHIPRLMVISNFAQLTQTSPQALLNWMRRVFIDATDWVMVPNVIGMSMHADGGQMMSKPYIAGGAYISKMSNYCESCPFNPKLRTGKSACPFTMLYWNFIDQNFETLVKNPRIARQVSGIKRLKDLEEIRIDSAEVIKSIRVGKL